MDELPPDEQAQVDVSVGDAQAADPEDAREPKVDEEPEGRTGGESDSDPEAIEADPSANPQDPELRDLKGG